MKVIEAIIERAKDGTYSVYCIDEPFSGMGDSPESAKANMIEAMQFHKEGCIEVGNEYPAFLDSEFEIAYKFDTESMLEYYSGILSLAGLERITGINRKQLWSYAHGRSKPRKAQVQKIEKALHRLGAELSTVSL